MPRLDLPDGYYDLPPGKMANIATFLEMREKPTRALRKLAKTAHLHRFTAQDVDSYYNLFRAVGENLMWFSRLYWPHEKLTAHFSDSNILSFAVINDAQPAGLLELNFTEADACELAFYGLVPAAQGKGLGGALLDHAIELAWARPIKRFWVHTCNFDGPMAMPIYLRAGFKPYARKIEIHDDPRLAGLMKPTASPHIPMINLTEKLTHK